MVDIQAWLERTQNQYWDMDGAYGAQCWDLWAKYCMDNYNLSLGDCITPTGYAAGNYIMFPTTSAVGRVFEKKDTNYTPGMGDVVFWKFGSQNYPGSHVAIVWGGVQGDSIDVLTQNPTPAVHQLLPLAKDSQLLGYLHPTALPEPPESGDNPTGGNNPGVSVGGDISAWIQLQGDNLVYHSGSGTTSSQAIFYKSSAQTWIYRGGTGQPDADHGQGTPSVGDGKSSYALYVIGTVESSLRWDAVEPNNQGIGIAQWSFGRRLEVRQSKLFRQSRGHRVGRHSRGRYRCSDPKPDARRTSIAAACEGVTASRLSASRGIAGTAGIRRQPDWRQ